MKVQSDLDARFPQLVIGLLGAAECTFKAGVVLPLSLTLGAV